MAFKLRTTDEPSPLRQDNRKQIVINSLQKEIAKYTPYLNEKGEYNQDLKLKNKFQTQLDRFKPKTPAGNYYEAVVMKPNETSNVLSNPNFNDVQALAAERTQRGYNTNTYVSGNKSNLFNEAIEGQFSVRNGKRNYNPQDFDKKLYAKLMKEHGGVSIQNGVMTGTDEHEEKQTITKNKYDLTTKKANVLSLKNKRQQESWNATMQKRYDKAKNALSRLLNN